MPNPNSIVALILRIEPPLEKQTGESFLRQHTDGVAIVFEDDQVSRLFPGENNAGVLEILDGLRQIQAPAYVEIDPESRAITRLLIPLVTRVTTLKEAESAVCHVMLEASHARHLLKRDNPDFESLLTSLRTSQEKKNWLLVTETDEHEIIDVRPSPREPSLPTNGLVKKEKHFLCRFFCWCCCFFRWCRCVSAKKAKEMFDRVSATTCHPLTVPPPCIPFLYPDDGCWARAHEMCRLMLAAGVQSRKVWIDGGLQVNTKNNPNCKVNWGWHVAPTLCVRRRFFSVEDRVIDPSLFTGPVSKATWKSVQGDPNATLTDTAASVYWRNYIPTDPNYVDTNIRLQYYRLALKNRSLLPAGPPPYAYCP